MKKLFCITLAVLMVLSVLPFAAFAANDKIPGVQSTGTADAQITTAVCSIWYTVGGVETKYGDYDSLDFAMDAMYDLYKDPFVDESIVDGDDEDTNVSNELYEAAGSPVIRINGNHVGAYARPNWITDKAAYKGDVYYRPDRVVNFVIDGAKNENENYTITYNSHTQIFNNLAFYNVTVKNVNFVMNSGASTDDGAFKWQGNETAMYINGSTPGESWTVFENCVIDHNSTLDSSGSGCTFKINGNAKNLDGNDPCKTDKYHLIFKDTSVYSGAGIGSQVHWGADANIELYNSTWTVDGANGIGNNNDNIIKPYEAGNCYFYLDGTSKLVSNRSGSGTVSLFRILAGQKAPVTIELAEGAELAMANVGTLSRKTYIAGDLSDVEIIDNGAIYTASALDAKTGVDFPISFKDASWLAGDGVAATVAHPVTETVDETTGDSVFNTDTSRVIYKNESRGAILTKSGNAPLTVKKNGAEVEIGATDLNHAFDYVYSQADSEAYTIYLNAGVTTNEYFNPETYDSKAVKTVAIDGQGNTLTSYNATAFFYGIGLYNLKLSNINLLYGVNQASSLDWSPRKTPSDNYGNYIATGSNPVVDTHSEFTNVVGRPVSYAIKAGNFKLKGGNGTQNKGAYGIKLVDSEFTSTLEDTMFMMNDKGNLDLDIIGTTLNYIGGANYTHLGNNSIIIMNGAEVDINIENSANNVSVLNAATTSTPASCGIFANHTTYNVNVTLGKDVELYLTGNNAKTSACFFAEEKATTTITDNGAKWIVGKDLLDNGAAIALPTSMFKDSAKDHVWYVGDEAVANPYADATVTADVTLTHAIPVDPAEGKVAYIEVNGNKEYYVTLSSAINALGALYDAVTTENLTDDALWQAAGSPVIYLYDDITIASETYPSWGTATNYNANRVRTVVIEGAKKDGTNPLITSTVAGAAFSYNAYYNLTLKNIDLTCTQGFALFWRGYNGNKSAKSTTNMINCNISATGTSGEGLVFKVTGNQNATKTENYIINMVNTDVVAQKGVNAVFLFHHGCAGELTIDGNSSIHHIQNKSSAGGDTMFMLGSQRQFTINVESGAKLSAEAQVGWTSSSAYKSYAIFRLENSNTANYVSADGIKNIINIEDGVEMSLTATESFGMPIYFIQNNHKLTNNDINIADGAIFKVDANGVKNANFAVYAGAGVSDLGTVIGTRVNGDNTKLYNSTIAKGAIEGAVTLTPVFYNPADFAMVDGASLRTVYNENGIRFSTTYTDALKEIVGTQATFGTLIAPTKLLGDANVTLDTEGALNIVSTESKRVDGEGVTTYHAAVLMTPEGVAEKDIYTLELAARAYMTIAYADGSTATIYAVADDNVRDMYTTAKNLAAAGETNAVIEHIISVCEA